MGWSTRAGLQCPACAWAVGAPQVSENHFSPLLYHTETPSAVFVGIVTFSWLSFHSMFVPATAQIKKDRATSQNWLNGGWKMVVNYLLQGKLGEKWGEEWTAESLVFSPAFSWGTAQWHNVQDVLCSCTLQSRSTDPMGILLQGGAPSSTAKGCCVSEHWSINPKIFWAISKQFEWSTKQFQQRGLI